MNAGLTCALALALFAGAAGASPVEELRVRADTALRDAQICCNRVDDGAVPGETLSPCRQDLRPVEDRYSEALRLIQEGDYAFARDALEDTIKSAREVLDHCGGSVRRR